MPWGFKILEKIVVAQVKPGHVKYVKTQEFLQF